MREENIKSRTTTTVLGNWLFGGNRVFRLSEPDKMLKQKTIHWDRETCDVEDENDVIYYNVPWDDLEFWDPVEYHISDK